MDVFRFGFGYWKKYLPLSLMSKVCSLIALLCDLALPLLSAGFIDYVIAYDPAASADEGIFSFLYTGRFGEPGSWQLFGAIAIAFCIILSTRLVCVYI